MECEGNSQKNQSKTLKKEQCQQPVEKKSGFRSLFSFFKGSTHRRALVHAGSDHQASPNNSGFKKGRLGSSFSTTSLPTGRRPSTVASTASEPLPEIPTGGSDSVDTLPSLIRPPFSHRPSSSSSSSSSYEYGSETSTPATTPSNSSASSLRSRELEGARSNASLKKAKRASECYRSSPSPLSTVTAARNYPYILPHQLQTRCPQREENAQEQMKRRNSISRLMMRRAQSTPDLSSQDSPALPFPRLNGASSKRKSTIGKPSPYTIQDRLDHKAILGADPAGGMGFYLYPGSDKDATGRGSSGPGSRRPPRGGDQWKRNSWAGYDGDGAMDSSNSVGNARRAIRRDVRACGIPDFRRNVASEVIVEESHDAPEAVASNQRRFSEVPASSDSWDGNSSQTESIPAIPANSVKPSTRTSSGEPLTPATTPSSSRSSTVSIYPQGNSPTNSLCREHKNQSLLLDGTGQDSKESEVACFSLETEAGVIRRIQSEETNSVTRMDPEEATMLIPEKQHPGNCAGVMHAPMIK